MQREHFWKSFALNEQRNEWGRPRGRRHQEFPRGQEAVCLILRRVSQQRRGHGGCRRDRGDT